MDENRTPEIRMTRTHATVAPLADDVRGEQLLNIIKKRVGLKRRWMVD